MKKSLEDRIWDTKLLQPEQEEHPVDHSPCHVISSKL